MCYPVSSFAWLKLLHSASMAHPYVPPSKPKDPFDPFKLTEGDIVWYSNIWAKILKIHLKFVPEDSKTPCMHVHSVDLQCTPARRRRQRLLCGKRHCSSETHSINGVTVEALASYHRSAGGILQTDAVEELASYHRSAGDVSDETAASGSMQLQEADAMAACATTDRVTGNQPETQTKPEISQLGCGHAMDNEGSSESAAFKLQEAKKWMAKQYYPMRSKSLLQYNDDQVDRLELPHVRSLMKGAHVLLSSADGLWTETTFREFDDQRNCVILEYWNEMLGRIIQRHHEIPELAVPKQPKDSPPPAQEPEIRRLSCGHAVNNKAEHCPVCVRHFNELEQELAFQVANGAPPRSVPRAEWTELDETIIREMQAEMLPKMQAKKRKLIPEEARRRVQRKRD